MRDEVIKSNTPWVCASCYTCYVRCPKSIRITDVMYALKRLAMKEGEARPETRAAWRMADGFVSLVHRLGRNSETDLMRKIYLDPRQLGKLFRDIPIGMRLFWRGRMPIFRKRISSAGRKQLNSILEAVDRMEGL
jgi:heterodisulfide reductase subunit C